MTGIGMLEDLFITYQAAMVAFLYIAFNDILYVYTHSDYVTSHIQLSSPYMLGAHVKRVSIIRSLNTSFVRFPAFLPRRSLATQFQYQIPASVDDKALITLFDNPTANFRKSPFSVTGLFGHPNLTYPGALISLAEATVIRARLLTDRILRARESRDELLKVVKNLDRLSDMLCAVIDLAELVRNAHPDRMWVEAANKAYETLCEFMNVLNTHVGLYEVCQVLSSSSPSVHFLGFESRSFRSLYR